MEQIDVLVVGAGPAGLVLAGDLARAGRSVVVLERRAEVNPASRAFATMPRTLELLDARGVAAGLIAGGNQMEHVDLVAGIRLHVDRVDSAFPFVLIRPQVDVDRALLAYAQVRGAEIRRGNDVVGIDQDDDGVVVHARSEEGESTWRASYVVGADGAHSTVRDLIGVPFPGRTVLSSMALADVRLASGPTGNGVSATTTRDLLAFLVPYGKGTDDDGGRWFRSMTWDRRRQLPDSAPVSETEVADVLTRAVGRDLGLVQMGWHSRFHSDERQVPEYRIGRAFLVGDAAHVHSPVGGQGMNTGIQDAVNLAWKLDAVLGGAPDAVLDTYESERRPVGRQVLRRSGGMLRIGLVRPRVLRALRDVVAPRLLGVSMVERTAVGGLAGTTLSYGRRGLVGSRASRVPLDEGRLEEVQRRAGFVLVMPRDEWLDPVETGVRVVNRTDAGPALLVRPDGYVAWAGHDDTWRPVLRSWMGPRSAMPARAEG